MTWNTVLRRGTGKNYPRQDSKPAESSVVESEAMLRCNIYVAVTALSLAAAVLAEGPGENKPGPKAPKQVTLRQAAEAIEWTLTGLDAWDSTINVMDSRLPDSVKAGSAELARAAGSTLGFSIRALAMDPDVKVVVDGKEATLKDLKPLMRATIRFAKDSEAVATVEAKTKFKGAPPRRWLVRGLDPRNRRLSVISEEDGFTINDLPVAKDTMLGLVNVASDPRIPPLGDAKLEVEVLQDGEPVGLELSRDKRANGRESVLSKPVITSLKRGARAH